MAKQETQEPKEIVPKDGSFLEIDDLQLDKEWGEQPKLAFTYLRKLAIARHRMDEAKAELELEEARLGQKMREFPERFGLSKVTEKAIESAIITHDDYQEALSEYNDCKYKVDLIDAAVKSIDQRKYALQKKVELFGMEYFSEPKASNSNGKAAQDHLEKKAARGRVRQREEEEE